MYYATWTCELIAVLGHNAISSLCNQPDPDYQLRFQFQIGCWSAPLSSLTFDSNTVKFIVMLSYLNIIDWLRLWRENVNAKLECLVCRRRRRFLLASASETPIDLYNTQRRRLILTQPSVASYRREKEASEGSRGRHRASFCRVCVGRCYLRLWLFTIAPTGVSLMMISMNKKVDAGGGVTVGVITSVWAT